MNIIEKSPEALQGQLGQINLYREVKERKGPLESNFIEYVASLRGLRRFQYLERKHLQGIAQARVETDVDGPEPAFESTSFLGRLAEKETDLLFTKAEKRALAGEYIGNNTAIFLQRDTAGLLKEQGILDEPLIKQVVFQVIKGIDFAPIALTLLPLTPSITPLQLHDAFMESFTETTRHSRVDMIGVAEGYLSEEEMLIIVKKHFQINPDFHNYADAEFRRIFSGNSQFEIARIIVEHPKLRLYDDACMLIHSFQAMTSEQRKYLYDCLFDRWEALMEERKRLPVQFKGGEDVDGEGIPEDIQIQNMFRRWDGLDFIVKDYPAAGKAKFALRVLKSADSDLFENFFGRVLEELDGEGIVELVDHAVRMQDERRLYSFIMCLQGCADKTSKDQFRYICHKLSALLPEEFRDSISVAHVVERKLGPSA